jgi:hypothetical protein
VSQRCRREGRQFLAIGGDFNQSSFRAHGNSRLRGPVRRLWPGVDVQNADQEANSTSTACFLTADWPVARSPWSTACPQCDGAIDGVDSAMIGAVDGSRMPADVVAGEEELGGVLVFGRFQVPQDIVLDAERKR